MRPDALTFANTEGSRPDEQFVHWLGKGSSGQQEWVFRMYSITDPAGARENRISFYVFEGNTPPPIRGCGSYFQDPVQAGQWITLGAVAGNSAKTTPVSQNGGPPNTNPNPRIVQ